MRGSTQAIAEAWCRILDVEVADADDEFFELGGDSVLGLAFVEKVEAALRITFPLEALFRDGTFAGIVAACDETLASDAGRRTA